MKDSDSHLKNKPPLEIFPEIVFKDNNKIKKEIENEGKKIISFILLCIFFFLSLAIYLSKKDDLCFFFSLIDGIIASMYFYNFYVEREKRINNL